MNCLLPFCIAILYSPDLNNYIISYVSFLCFCSMPPWGVPPSGPPATYTGQPTGPNGQPSGGRLFPSTSTGPDRKPTFPAYGE